MALDHTFDLGQLKEQLTTETNKKDELWQLSIKQGDYWSKKKQEAEEAKNQYMQVKTKIKIADERIKTLKTLINTEKEMGG